MPRLMDFPSREVEGKRGGWVPRHLFRVTIKNPSPSGALLVGRVALLSGGVTVRWKSPGLVTALFNSGCPPGKSLSWTLGWRAIRLTRRDTRSHGWIRFAFRTVTSITYTMPCRWPGNSHRRWWLFL